MNFPRGFTVESSVCRIAPPKTLYEARSRRDLSVEMFLSLLLLNFQGKAWPEDSLQQTGDATNYLLTQGREKFRIDGLGS